MGLLDAFLKGTGDPERDAAINQGLLQAGLALMQSRGKLFPAIGQAGQVGLQAAQQTRMQQQAMRRAGLQDKLIQNQLGQQQREAEIAALPGQFYRAPSQTGIDATGGMETSTDLPSNQGGPGGFDMQGYIQALMSKRPAEALQLRAAMAKPTDRMVVGKDQRVIENGRVTIDALPDTPKPSALAQLLQERAALPDGSPLRAAYDDAIKKATTHQPPSQMNNYGSPVAGVDPNTGRPAFGVTDRQGNVKVLTSIAPPKTAAEAKAEEEQRTRGRQGQQMMSAMTQAREILKAGNTTASGFGNLADAGARMFGQTTVGAQDAAKLEALSGWLVANVPRMEGPQSNFDVINYTTMAGKVGDRTVPIKERLAALDVVEQLQRKYAEINGTPMGESPTGAQPAGGGLKLPTAEDIAAEARRRAGGR